MFLCHMASARESIKLSLIVPVYNRPGEVAELLESLTRQTAKQFEVLIVEDGSSLSCENIVSEFASRLEVRYFFKPNSGPGLTRNFGFEHMNGDFAIVLDSDCVIPERYIEVVTDFLRKNPVDAYGGPDRAADDFTPLQKAINYAMTSILTTGGIRGGSEALGAFHPRSFNMGMSRDVINATGGFSAMRFGEDIDLSIRIIEAGFKTALIRDAWVWHKRRTRIRPFFKQVFNSGIARINLHYRHPGTLRIVHTLPTAYILGVAVLLILGAAIHPVFFIPLAGWALAIMLHALCLTQDFWVSILSVITSVVQLSGYGLGFLLGVWRRMVLRRNEFDAFRSSFYH